MGSWQRAFIISLIFNFSTLIALGAAFNYEPQVKKAEQNLVEVHLLDEKPLIATEMLEKEDIIPMENYVTQSSPQKSIVQETKAAVNSEVSQTKATAVAGTLPSKGTGGGSINTGSSNTGSSSGTSVTQGAGWSIGDLRARFINSLERNKDYPYMARRQNQTGVVGMAVSLDASGNLAGVSVTSSSGYSQLDSAAVALVNKVCPFAHNAGRAVSFNVSIAYNLEG